MYNSQAWKQFLRKIQSPYKYAFQKFCAGIIFGCLTVVSINYVLIDFADYRLRTETNKTDLTTLSIDSDTQINLVNVVCGEDRMSLYFTLAKSAILFQNHSKLHFITIAEHKLSQSINEQFKTWQLVTNNSFTYEIRNVTHASDGKERYPNLDRSLMCSMERLHLPELLSNVNKVLYTDTDIIFLHDLSDIWNQFKLMNEDQICGGRYDFLYVKRDVNSGLLLMDLEKMRNFGWSAKIAEISEEIKLQMKSGDQDIINTLFNRFPKSRFLLPERFNYNPTDCMDLAGFCYDCASHGMSMIHGWLGTFLRNPPANAKEDPFNFIYRKFAEYKLGSDPYENLFKTFLNDFKKLEISICKISMEIYFNKMKTFVYPEQMKKKMVNH